MAMPQGHAHPGMGMATAHAGMGSQLAMEHAMLVDMLGRWRELPVMPLMGDGEKQLTEIVGSLEHIASRDSIRAGRGWIEANTAAAHAIAGNLMKRIGGLPTCAHRLHVLFLLHDVLQTEAAKPDPGRPLITAFRPYLVWMLRPAFQLAQSTDPEGGECLKVLKLLSLWQERNIIAPNEAVEIKAIATAENLPVIPAQAAAAAPSQRLGLPPGIVPLGGLMPQIRPGMVGGSQSLLGVLQQQALAKAQAQGQPMFPGFSGVLRPNVTGALAVALTTGALAQNAQTPETIPVGVMSSMLKQVSQRAKDMHTAFVPYKPLDPLCTPQALPPVAPANERLLQRLKKYYNDIGGDRFGETSKEDNTPVVLALPDAPRGAPAAVELQQSSDLFGAQTTSSESRNDAETSFNVSATEKRDAPRKTMCVSRSASRSRSPRGPRFVSARADQDGGAEGASNGSLAAIGAHQGPPAEKPEAID